MTKKAVELDEKLGEFVEGSRIRFEEGLLHRYNMIADQIKSPIEKLLLMAMLTEHQLSPLHDWFFFKNKTGLTYEAIAADEYPFDHVRVYPQVKAGAYRVDFLIRSHYWGKYLDVVVECDGHDFHERTKEQAAKDKERDRWFTARGFRVLRFTGSEIWRDAGACVEAITDALERFHGISAEAA